MKRAYDEMAKEYWKMVSTGTTKETSFNLIVKGKNLKKAVRTKIPSKKNPEKMRVVFINELVKFKKAIASIKQIGEAKRLKKAKQHLVKHRLGC